MQVSLSGGLGNQMFQYAFGYSYSVRNDEKMMMDTFYLGLDKNREYGLAQYGISMNRTGRIRGMIYFGGRKIAEGLKLQPIWNHINRTIYEEKPLLFQTIEQKNSFAIGNWINEAYFKEFRERLVSEFTLLKPLTSDQELLLNEIRSNNSLAIHIRRGDYLKPENKAYAVIRDDYYDKALAYIQERTDNLNIFVFSDDIEWCRREFSQIANVTFVDEDISGDPYVDLELMRNCKYFIIANSTFSWWGAWLSERKDKIMIAPDMWYGEKKDDDFNIDVRDAILKDFIIMD